MAFKILHIGQLIGGLDVYIRNSIVFSPGHLEHVIAHGKADIYEPIVKDSGSLIEYKTSLQRSIGLKDIKTLKEVISIIKEEKPDVIHCHSAKGGIIGRLAALITRVPVAYTPHAFSFLCTSNPLKRSMYKILEKVTKGKAFVLACSNSEAELAINSIGYPRVKTLVWTNAVPDCCDRGVEAVEEEAKAVGKYICYIGRPSYQKNMELLVDTAELLYKAHPDVKITLLGVGYYSPDLEKLKRLIDQKGLNEYFILKPWLSHDECVSWIRNSLFYLTTSRYEGLPLSVIEAMSLSKAIIGTKVVGNVDCISHGINGFLGSNCQELAKGCASLIENISLRKQFESNSRIRYEKEFNILNRISELEDCYRTIVSAYK